MDTTGLGQRRRQGGRLGPWWWAGLAAVVVLGLLALRWLPRSEVVRPTGDLAEVQRGPLTIAVASSGTMRSGDAVVIKNQVEGMTTILWIIDEGTYVEAGDKLMVLDSSELEDEKLEEEIDVESSRAAHINAQQMLEIARKQGQANIESAGVQYRLALLDIEKYAGIPGAEFEELRASGKTLEKAPEGSLLGELNALAPRVRGDGPDRERFHELLEQMDGAYKQELRKALNEIMIAEAELRRSEDYYNDSKELAELDFIASTELQADYLDFHRKSLELEVAVDELELLANFTYRRTIEELASAVSQAAFELDRAKHQAEANVVDAEANMHGRNERLVRDQQHLREINEQLAVCTITAPQAGMVVYGTTGQDRDDREEPLAEGVQVRERQDLFRLPTSDGLVADLKIHESMLEKVQVGLPVRITTDALPGRAYEARITTIAVLPDAQSRWLNPNLKVYNTVAEVVGDSGELRTGMSCRAEVIVEELEDTLYLPIQTVVRVEGQPTVYRPTIEGDLAPHPIEVGLDDNRMVQVLSGLEEGDLVSLVPPLEEGQTSLAAERQRESAGAKPPAAAEEAPAPAAVEEPPAPAAVEGVSASRP